MILGGAGYFGAYIEVVGGPRGATHRPDGLATPTGARGNCVAIWGHTREVLTTSVS